MEDKKNESNFEDARDRLITDVLLRISSLEKLLVAKGLLTEQEIADSYLLSANKLLEIMAGQVVTKN